MITIQPRTLTASPLFIIEQNTVLVFRKTVKFRPFHYPRNVFSAKRQKCRKIAARKHKLAALSHGSLFWDGRGRTFLSVFYCTQTRAD
jgi:hypothetical protein